MRNWINIQGNRGGSKENIPAWAYNWRDTWWDNMLQCYPQDHCYRWSTSLNLTRHHKFYILVLWLEWKKRSLHPSKWSLIAPTYTWSTLKEVVSMFPLWGYKENERWEHQNLYCLLTRVSIAIWWSSQPLKENASPPLVPFHIPDWGRWSSHA